MTSRIASAGSKVVRKPPSSRVAVVLVSLVLAACATVPSREPSDDARRVLALLTERSGEFTDLRALADISLTRGRQRQRLRGVLLVKAPGSVRFEALSPLGPPLLIVTVHEGRMAAYDATKHEVLEGEATAESVAKILGLPLGPEDLVAVLAGRLRTPRDLKSAELLPPDDAGPSLSLEDAGGSQRVWVDPQTGTIRQREIHGSRFNALVKYRRDAGNLSGFDLDAAQSYVTGSVTYQNLVEGQGIDAERFTFAVPKGAKTQTIR
jgi:outer membrane lipoprotein-sorting protein